MAITMVAITANCTLSVQMESDALAQREAALAANQATHQAELDSLLAKQEERLRAWEAGCAEMEDRVEEKRKVLAAEEDRYNSLGSPCTSCCHLIHPTVKLPIPAETSYLITPD